MARDPNFFLTKEGDAELMNMVLSAYQARYFERFIGYLPGRPSQVVPVTQYLYHEYIPCIFGFTGVHPPAVARMILNGQIPSLASWRSSVQPVDELPKDTQTLLTDYYTAMDGYARPYLLYGKMTTPPVMDVPTVRRKVEEKSRGLSLKMDDPLVVTSAWRDEEGRFAVFAVNVTGRPLSVRCAVPTLKTERVRQCRYIGAETAGSGKSVTPETSFDWTIPPLRLCGLVFEPDQ